MKAMFTENDHKQSWAALRREALLVAAVLLVGACSGSSQRDEPVVEVRSVSEDAAAAVELCKSLVGS